MCASIFFSVEHISVDNRDTGWNVEGSMVAYFWATIVPTHTVKLKAESEMRIRTETDAKRNRKKVDTTTRDFTITLAYYDNTMCELARRTDKLKLTTLKWIEEKRGWIRWESDKTRIDRTKRWKSRRHETKPSYEHTQTHKPDSSDKDLLRFVSAKSQNAFSHADQYCYSRKYLIGIVSSQALFHFLFSSCFTKLGIVSTWFFQP